MKKMEDSHIRELTVQPKALEQKEANSHRRGRCHEIIKLRGKINKVEPGKQYKKIDATKSWLLEKINKIVNPLSNLPNKYRENMEISKIRIKKWA